MIGLFPPLRESWTRRDLVAQLTYKDVVGRYRGSSLGVFWSLFNPLLMLAVYTLAFRDILAIRWEQAGDTHGDYAAFLFTGLIVHSLFAECLNRAPLLVVEHPNYVKKVPFPLQSLAWVLLGSTLFHALASALVLILFLALTEGGLSASVLLLPLVLLPALPMLLGIIWILAATGVYLRDTAQVTAPLATALLFLSPVFYPSSAVPALLTPFITLNPLTLIIEQTRRVLLQGSAPDWLSLTLYLLVACAVAMFGLALFQKARTGFAEVL